MLKSETTNQLDFHSYLPPYRSLLSPHARYDYRTHSLIPVSQNDLSLPNLNGAGAGGSGAGANKKSKIKMKYKSLLGDVSRRTSILSLRINHSALNSTTSQSQAQDLDHLSINSSTFSKQQQSQSQSQSQSQAQMSPISPVQPPIQFKNLPIEILEHILDLVDDFEDYKCCLLVSKQFYQLTKPFVYRSLSFTSTYKFAQFVSYLRLNSEVGVYVKEVDLSGIKPSNFGIEEEDESVEEVEFDHHRLIRNNRQSIDENNNHENNQMDDSNNFTHPFILAGWRDWKYKSNPLYSINSSSSFNLTKIKSNSQVSARSLRSANYSIRTSSTSTNFSTASNSSSKIQRLSKYFKNRKRQRIGHHKSLSTVSSNQMLNLGNVVGESTQPIIASSPSSTALASSRRLVQHPHPSMNKLLYNYSSSKDIPIGYVLHTLNLCPNLVSINLANLSLSVDYEIDPKMTYKYQTYDLMNNYSKDLIQKINKLMTAPVFSDESIYSGSNSIRALSDRDSLRSFPFYAASIRSTIHAAGNSVFNSIHNINSGSNYTNSVNAGGSNNLHGASSASSVYSFHPPTRPRYNSLLPPLPQNSVDMSYLNKGDGKVFLSDLNLKSINNNYLTRLQENELLNTIAKIHSNRFGIFNTLKYLNLSSMIWLTKNSIREFISEFIDDYQCSMSDDENFDTNSLDTSSFHSGMNFCEHYYQDLVIDLTDSGMYKNLSWARKIDLNSIQGCRLARKIVRDEILDVNEYNSRREQVRRGRIGENYFS